MVSPRPKNILIVEDEQDIPHLVKHYLRRKDFLLTSLKPVLKR